MHNCHKNLIRTYVGWGKLMNKRVDSNLQEQLSNFKFRDEREVLGKFISISKRCTTTTAEDLFICAKLRASIYYLRQKLNNNIPYRTYLRNTIGITPQMISESEISGKTEKIIAELRKHGISYDRDEIIRKMYHRATISEMNRGFNQYKKQLLEQAEDYLGIRLTEKVILKFVHERSFWSFYLEQRENHFVLKVNLDKVRKRFNESVPKYAIIHEICGHALQLSSWRNRAKKNEISPVSLLQDDYGPEMFVLEGVAESLFYYVYNKNIDAPLRLMLMFDELKHMVQNNAYLMINSGKQPSKVADYYLRRVIVSEKPRVLHDLMAVRDDPLKRAVMPVYGPSLRFFKQMAGRLNRTQKERFLSGLYLRPMTYGQIRKYANLLRH